MLRRAFLALGVVVVLLLLTTATLIAAGPALDRLAYASPLGAAPEPIKDALRPWRVPKVDAISPQPGAQDVLERTPIVIRFSTPMNQPLTEQGVHITPAVKGSFTWHDDKTLAFTPAEDWPHGTTVTVTVEAGVRSWVLRGKDKPFQASFSVIGPPAVVETTPAPGARFAMGKGEDFITMTFNRPMDKDSVASHLVITPPLLLQRTAWLGNKLFVYGRIQPSTTYTVVLHPGARDATYGLEMTQPFTLTFTTTKLPPNLGILELGRYGMLAAAGPKTITLRVRNISQIDATLYRVDVPTYLKMYGFSWDDWRSFKADTLPRLRAWSEAVKAEADQDVQTTLDLGELPPGIYLLAVRAPEGIRDSQVIVVSRSSLTVKRAQGQVLAWATDLASGAPIPNLPVTVYDTFGQELAKGATDGNGLFLAETKPVTTPIHVIASAGDDVVVTSSDWQGGIEPWRFASVAWEWQPAAEPYRIFIDTDRPLYRPGQTVYFKGVVRRDHDGQYEAPPARTPVTVLVRNWENQTLYKKTLVTSAFGSYSDSFTISEEAKLGSYQVYAIVGYEPTQFYEYGRSIASLRVEEYRKPEYQVSVRADRPSYVNGDTVQVTINAMYFFGAPAGNAKVRYTIYQNDYWFTWAKNQDFDFSGSDDGNGKSRYFGWGRDILSREGTTDGNGNLVISLPADISQEERSQYWTIEATVMDPSNQPISNQTTIIVHRGLLYIGAQPASWVAVTSQPTSFQIQAVDLSGEAVGRQTIDYVLAKIEYQRTQIDTKEGMGVKPIGKPLYEWHEVRIPLITGTVTTDAAGKAVLPFTPSSGGSYRLELKAQDRRGNTVRGQAWLWVSDRAYTGWKFDNNDRIDLKADKRVYSPGDVAHVLIPSPYTQATALVTVERGRIMSPRLLPLQGGSTVVDIPIEPSYFPNVYVSAVLIPRGGEPSVKVGLIELRVQSDRGTLNVDIRADRGTYKPRDTATFTITTRDASGRPVSAEVSLSVVDAAILSLVGDTSQNIASTFWGRRPLSVQTGSSLTILLDRVNLRRDFGGGDLGAEQGLRKIFPDTAYWNPMITTDATGTAQVNVPLPDNLTTWRATAKGITADTRVGAAITDLVVTKDLLVRPVLPRFLRSGDQAVIGAIVHNYTGADREITIQAQIQGAQAQGSKPLSTKVRVASGGLAKVEWPIAVGTVNTITMTLQASAAAFSDGVEVAIPVQPVGEEVVVSQGGATERTGLRTITVPEGATYTTLKIEAAPSLAAGLLDSLQYLVGYPYGCTEQTLSRFIPTVLVKQTLDTLNLDEPKIRGELPKQVEKGLQRLYSFQRYDGGWGWWEADPSDPRLTAYVVYGLLQAQRAGFDVDQTVLRRGAQALRDPLAKTDDLNLKTYLVYVLTEYGEGDIALARSLMDRRLSLSIESQALLAQIFTLLASPTEAKAILNDVISKAITTATSAHWEEAQRDAKAMSSNGRTTAIVLQTLLRIDPRNPLVPKVVRWIMDRRLGGYWRTTQETAATIISLTEYLARTKELESAYTYSVTLDGRLLSPPIPVTPQTLTQRKTFTATNLTAGPHEVTLEKQGTGILYDTTTLRYFIPRAEGIAPASSGGGLAITREYRDGETGRKLTDIPPGSLVQVIITATIPHDMWYVILEDPLPAGLEAVNNTLRTSSIREGKVTGYWMHPELRDDKAVFFAYYLWPGIHTYTYMARATTPGVFHTQPATITPMYEPEVWARSGSMVVTVRP